MMKLLRGALARLSGLLPLGLQRYLDARSRAAAEVKKLKQSTVVVVSYPKSGRTWMRALLSYMLRDTYEIDTEELLGSRNYHRLDARAPVVFFTHDNYPRRVFGDARMDALYGGRKIVLLVRDPRDVEVSAFFHIAHRLDPVKRKLYDLEASGREDDVFDYLRRKFAAGRNALSFLNQWSEVAAAHGNVLVVRYEDLKAAAEPELRRICDFIGIDASDACLASAVEQASFSAMKRGEREGAFSHQNSRFGSRGQQSDDAFKVRKGKVGGYRDYMAPAEAAEIDAIVDARLVPGFGYRSDEATAAAVRAGR